MAGQALSSVEFDNKPSVLILSDSDAGRDRGLAAAVLSQSRVSDSASVTEGEDRLVQQLVLEAVYLSLAEDSGPPLDRMLTKLQADVDNGRYGIVVSAPSPLMDIVMRQLWHERVEFLAADADEVDEAAALMRVSARPRSLVHDIGREQALPRLQQISEEVRRIATALERISTEETKNEQAPSRGGEDRSKVMDAGAVRAIIRARRLRDQFFGPDLFADPAWDILLDLYAAQLEKQRVAVSSLCIAAAVPATTALRWIKTLTDMGLLVRAADPQDGRRVYIELAPQAAERLQAYLTAAQRISPLNL